MKNSKLVYCLTALACVCFINCENSIMKEWWVEQEPSEQEPSEVEYVPITKMVPQVTYETIIEHDIVYKQVFVQLPPEVIHDTIIQEVTVIKEVPVYIFETIIEKVPEIVYETITETEYVTVHDTVYVEVEKIVSGPPAEDDIIQYIKEHPSDVIEIIKQDPSWEEILKEIIKNIPPEELVTYLTDDQIKYIVQQQPPQVILQTITIIDIEYIIFAGNADQYNGPPLQGGSTPLTTQEINSNNASVSDIAKALLKNPDYLIMLHGHANPTAFTDAEIGDLEKLSTDRANAVKTELLKQYKTLGGLDLNDSRVSVSGYGGEKVLFGNNSVYTPLNRRVEMILVRVGVEQ